MANLLRLLFCVVVAYGAVVEEEMNALLEDSCEGECTLSLLQTLGTPICSKDLQSLRGNTQYTEIGLQEDTLLVAQSRLTFEDLQKDLKCPEVESFRPRSTIHQHSAKDQSCWP